MFVYCADTYCDACGRRIRQDLTAEGLAPADPDDERSYDSDDFPKEALEESTDCPDHCASGSECLDPIDLRDWGLASDAPMYGAESPVIGALLSDGLTDEGAAWLVEVLNGPERHPGLASRQTPYQEALHRFWREVFADELATVEV